MPTFNVGTEVPTSAQKIWDTLKDSKDIIPKLAPHAVSSIEHVEGPEEGVGGVRITKLGSAAPPGAFVKEKLIAYDPSAFTVTTEEIEGGHLSQGFTKWVSIVKFTPVSDSSSKWETTVEYEGGNEATVGPTVARAKETLPKLILGLSAYINKSA